MPPPTAVFISPAKAPVYLARASLPSHSTLTCCPLSFMVRWRQLKYGFPFPQRTRLSSLHLSLLSTMIGISAEPAESMCDMSHYTMGACSLMPCGPMVIHADKTKSPEIKALSTRCSTGFSPKIRPLRCSHHPAQAQGLPSSDPEGPQFSCQVCDVMGNKHST